MRAFTLLMLGSAGAVFAQEARQRMMFTPAMSSSSSGVVLAAMSSCDIGEKMCETGCMPAGSVCCGDGTNTYCPAGSECTPQACCPIGKTCKGGGGPAQCAPGKTLCGSGCMPLLGDCCSDGTYCPAYTSCTKNGCAASGLGSGGSSGGGSSSGGSPSSDSIDVVLPTTTFTSSAMAIPTSTAGDDDDFGVITTPKPQTTAGNDDDFGVTTTSKPQTTAAVDDDESSASGPTTTEASNTPTGLQSITPTTTVFQQAGGHYTADGKLVAGLAVAAALLV